MILHKNMEAEINLLGGVLVFKEKMEIAKKTQPISKKYIFDIWIVYADILHLSPDLKVTEDVIELKNDIVFYLEYFQEIQKNNYNKSVNACVNIMKYNLEYVKNLRLFAS